MSKTFNRASLVLAGAAFALCCALPAAAQTTTVPGTTKSSPAGRDAQGHASDSTAPSARAGMAHDMGKTDSMDTMKKPRTTMTPENTSPGAGNRNGGNAVPPTSGAAGR